MLDVVHDELVGLAGRGEPCLQSLATEALGQLDWLGDPVDTSTFVIPDRVIEIQDILRSGRSLKHPAEHWAESVIMAMAERLQHTDPHMLSEDYNARVESTFHHVTPFSIHKLLARMVRQGGLTAGEAAAFAQALEAADRGADYTTDDFLAGRLGRVGRP
ncbi:hypothetical protein AB0M87_10460 [Streptomyces sp. NPDC051320]|uniref:hypothetical protein n=1 Tax=Streptomyces sp. NPDC051320 TaxID=3154644 RepID=UPI0034430294